MCTHAYIHMYAHTLPTHARTCSTTKAKVTGAAITGMKSRSKISGSSKRRLPTRFHISNSRSNSRRHSQMLNYTGSSNSRSSEKRHLTTHTFSSSSSSSRIPSQRRRPWNSKHSSSRLWLWAIRAMWKLRHKIWAIREWARWVFGASSWLWATCAPLHVKALRLSMWSGKTRERVVALQSVLVTAWRYFWVLSFTKEGYTSSGITVCVRANNGMATPGADKAAQES